VGRKKQCKAKSRKLKESRADVSYQMSGDRKKLKAKNKEKDRNSRMWKVKRKTNKELK